MEEIFELPVEYRGKERNFTASLIVIGYTHKFIINVNGHQVTFEPDEERNYRAVLNDESLTPRRSFDVGLIKAIAEKLEELIR